MFPLVIGAIAVSAGSAIAGAKQAKKLAKKQTKAYQMAAAMMKDATEKYSGTAADQRMRQEGEMTANRLNNMAMNGGPLESNMSIQNAVGAADNLQDMTETGVNLGRENAAQDLSAKYNKAAAEANRYLQNAQIENAIDAQKYQNLMGAVSGGAQLLANMGITDPISAQLARVNGDNQGQGQQQSPGSDENLKESPKGKESDLPEAKAEDALRQIESVEYEYKDPNYPGCDDERHVGITAQSLEKGAFKDAVKKDLNGIRHIDQWKLQESIMSGISALQKELDELEGNQSKKNSK